jgi:Zn-dependent protease with chaperone function
VSERPNTVFGWLVASATALTLAITGALAVLGIGGVAALAATIIGALTACVFFLTELDRVPVSALVLVVLALASTAAFARTLWTYQRERLLLAALPVATSSDAALTQVAEAAGVTLYVTPASRAAAFCFGLLRPRVVVTSGLLERLTLEEQAAVVWHEAEHVRNREPLKCLVARLASNTFFWIPLLRDLLDRFLLVKEIAADQRAVAHTERAALVGALYEVASAPSLAAVGAGDFASARIERLFSPQTALPPLFRRRHAAVSAIGVAALTLTLAFPAQLDLGEQTHLHAMLTNSSLHGLPGMAGGLAVNALILSIFGIAWRRIASGRASVDL